MNTRFKVVASYNILQYLCDFIHVLISVTISKCRKSPKLTNIVILPNTSELVKHKTWDCIQARRAWKWATYIMHKLCGVRTGNYNNFNWKQALFGKRIPQKIGKMIKIWYLLRGITLWTAWIERKDKVFNHEQWQESKV
jgi:hypothetical protein